MVVGRNKHQWEHTSHILWLLYQVNATKDSPRKTPGDFNPFTVKQQKRRKVDFVTNDLRFMTSLFKGANGS